VGRAHLSQPLCTECPELELSWSVSDIDASGAGLEGTAGAVGGFLLAQTIRRRVALQALQQVSRVLAVAVSGWKAPAGLDLRQCVQVLDPEAPWDGGVKESRHAVQCFELISGKEPAGLVTRQQVQVMRAPRLYVATALSVCTSKSPGASDKARAWAEAIRSN
jgi:hypothetical protein